MTTTLSLFRPVGLFELKKIWDSGRKKFPPRLSGQPFFYPVLQWDYAVQIAQNWNTKDAHSGYCGFVTYFTLSSAFLNQFEIKQVGSKIHQEYWIPAEKLEQCNANIIGEIQVLQAFYGSQYQGERPDFFQKTPEEQKKLWYHLFYKKGDLQ